MISEILVVCVGNICRSPVAAALLSDALGADSTVIVSSAGIGALVGYPAVEHSLDLMRESGLDISRHSARQLNRELTCSADLILLMEAEFKTAVTAVDPTARSKTFRLREWRDGDVPDPYQQPRKVFEEALALIREGVSDWVPRIQEYDDRWQIGEQKLNRLA